MFSRSRALNRLLSAATRQPRKEFLRAHWNVIVAADFFTVEVWTPKGLTRYIVFFVLELSTRRVARVLRPSPDGFWMIQMARRLAAASLTESERL
jgi:hypothetical protein